MKSSFSLLRWTMPGLICLVLLALGSSASAVTVDDLIRLKLAGVGEETILHVVEAEGGLLYLGVDDIIDLREAGASDAFLRALIDLTPDGSERAATGSSYRQESYRDDYGSRWQDEYDLYEPFDYYDDYTIVFTNYYYDPFAYHWHVWPRYYVYYSPFWWSHTGFYYAGFWSRDWWDPWSACVWYCDWHWGYNRYYGRSQTRAAAGRTWRRVREATAERIAREKRIYRRAGAGEPPRSVR
ncbi:MAG: hypothetical protein GF330_07275, partial [Candidatus Eisenbacteria bacterium]|nr:hypothetical protein [Candidatus Eisenbacteria bacterium]